MDEKIQVNVLILGATVKDTVTGFCGTLTGYCTYLSGFDRVLVEAKSTDGKPGESEWFDVGRVVVIDAPVG